MRRVQLKSLEGADVLMGQMVLIGEFVQAAHAQGFDADWVEAVLINAIANHCVDFKAILLAHVEIIPTLSSPHATLQLQYNDSNPLCPFLMPGSHANLLAKEA